MNRTLNWLRLLLCTFSGEDDFIIRRCSASIQKSFALIGLFVIFAFGGCFISATVFISAIFGQFSGYSLIVGVFWACVVTIIYLLLLYTISPPILPFSKKKKIKGRNIHIDQIIQEKKPSSLFTFSFIFRIVFISVLAIIIAQPLNVFILTPFTESSIENYKMEYRVEMIISSDSSLIKKEMLMQNEFFSNINTKKHPDDSIEIADNIGIIKGKIQYDDTFLRQSKLLLDTLKKINIKASNKLKSDSIRNELSNQLNNELYSDSSFLSQIDGIIFVNSQLHYDYEILKNSLKNIIKEKTENLNKLNILLAKSNFYVARIKIIIAENYFAWLFTLIGCGIFLLPIYLKFVIRNRTDFYKIKEKIEKAIVLDDYNEFKKEYSEVFKRQFKLMNDKTEQNIYPLLDKLEKINPKKYNNLYVDIQNEMKFQIIEKYEYWADMPFRTIRKKDNRILLTEKELLTKIYGGNN
ncbi:MAG: DUF4407 domain-containing protein [Bacteroidota bacterium]